MSVFNHLSRDIPSIVPATISNQILIDTKSDLMGHLFVETDNAVNKNSVICYKKNIYRFVDTDIVPRSIFPR